MRRRATRECPPRSSPWHEVADDEIRGAGARRCPGVVLLTVVERLQGELGEHVVERRRLRGGGRIGIVGFVRGGGASGRWVMRGVRFLHRPARHRAGSRTRTPRVHRRRGGRRRLLRRALRRWIGRGALMRTRPAARGPGRWGHRVVFEHGVERAPQRAVGLSADARFESHESGADGEGVESRAEAPIFGRVSPTTHIVLNASLARRSSSSDTRGSARSSMAEAADGRISRAISRRPRTRVVGVVDRPAQRFAQTLFGVGHVGRSRSRTNSASSSEASAGSSTVAPTSSSMARANRRFDRHDHVGRLSGVVEVEAVDKRMIRSGSSPSRSGRAMRRSKTIQWASRPSRRHSSRTWVSTLRTASRPRWC